MFLCWILFPVLQSLHFSTAGRGQEHLHTRQSDCLPADKQIQKRYWVSSVNHWSLSEVLTSRKHFANFFHTQLLPSYKLGAPCLETCPTPPCRRMSVCRGQADSWSPALFLSIAMGKLSKQNLQPSDLNAIYRASSALTTDGPRKLKWVM